MLQQHEYISLRVPPDREQFELLLSDFLLEASIVNVFWNAVQTGQHVKITVMSSIAMVVVKTRMIAAWIYVIQDLMFVS